jgi:hypothetical protein
MLSEAPGKTIRLFFADWNHELYHNRLGHFENKPLSLAVHPHHCPITLFTTRGFFTNYRMYLVRDGQHLRFPYNWPTLRQFVFDSKLLGGKGGFTAGEPGNFAYQSDGRNYAEGQSAVMEAKGLHTVFVPKEERAAWLVFEGPSDPDHKPVAYSNTDLTLFNPEGLYESVGEKQIERWLKIAQVLV